MLFAEGQIVLAQCWGDPHVCDEEGRPCTDAKVPHSEQLLEILPKDTLRRFYIKCVVTSPTDENLVYVGTTDSLLVADLARKCVRARFKVPYGVDRIAELRPASFWCRCAPASNCLRSPTAPAREPAPAQRHHAPTPTQSRAEIVCLIPEQHKKNRCVTLPRHSEKAVKDFCFTGRATLRLSAYIDTNNH